MAYAGLVLIVEHRQLYILHSWSIAEVESLRTHFEVLGLGLEASSPRKLPCPRLEDSTIFEPLKFRLKTPETLRKICKDLFLVSSSRDRLKKNF